MRSFSWMEAAPDGGSAGNSALLVINSKNASDARRDGSKSGPPCTAIRPIESGHLHRSPALYRLEPSRLSSAMMVAGCRHWRSLFDPKQFLGLARWTGWTNRKYNGNNILSPWFDCSADAIGGSDIIADSHPINITLWNACCLSPTSIIT